VSYPCRHLLHRKKSSSNEDFFEAVFPSRKRLEKKTRAKNYFLEGFFCFQVKNFSSRFTISVNSLFFSKNYLVVEVRWGKGYQNFSISTVAGTILALFDIRFARYRQEPGFFRRETA
jgi:hypothetical protein